MHLSEIEQLNAEVWARAKSQLFLELGREPLPLELAVYVTQSQLMLLLMTVLTEEERILFFKHTLQVVQQGRATGMVS